MKRSDLSDEFIAKAKECANVDELKELARQEAVELSDDNLEFISGGTNGIWYGPATGECDTFDRCPNYRECFH